MPSPSCTRAPLSNTAGLRRSSTAPATPIPNGSSPPYRARAGTRTTYPWRDHTLPPNPYFSGLITMSNQISNTEFTRRREAATPRGVGVMCNFYADRADNAALWDIEGNRYIDFARGIAVLTTGHRHPRLISEIGRAHVCT